MFLCAFMVNNNSILHTVPPQMMQAKAAFTDAAWLSLRHTVVRWLACTKFTRSFTVLETSCRPWDARMTSSIWSRTSGSSVSPCRLKNIQNIMLSVYKRGHYNIVYILGKNICFIFEEFYFSSN